MMRNHYGISSQHNSMGHPIQIYTLLIQVFLLPAPFSSRNWGSELVPVT